MYDLVSEEESAPEKGILYNMLSQSERIYKTVCDTTIEIMNVEVPSIMQYILPAQENSTLILPINKTYDSSNPSIDDYNNPIVVIQYDEPMIEDDSCPKDTITLPFENVLRFPSETKYTVDIDKPFAYHNSYFANNLHPHTIFKCHKCEFKTKYKGRIIIHVNNHLGIKPYECHNCKYKANTKQNLTRHMVSHTGLLKYTCNHCDYRSNEPSKVVRHTGRRHAISKSYKCNDCAYAAFNKRAILYHLNTDHCKMHQEQFQCKKCDFCSESRMAFEFHMHKEHGKQLLVCTKCNFIAKRPYSLNRHIAMHNNLKPFQCNICNYASASKYTLIRHISVHTGEKQFKCDQCEYSATEKRYVLKHKAAKH